MAKMICSSNDMFKLRNNLDHEIKNLCLELKRKEIQKYNKEYGVEAQRVNKINGGFTDWYRNATNHKDEKIGEHELKSIKLKINDYSEKESRLVYESN